LNRIDRLHAILTHLQSKKKVTAQEIADRFNISLRTVYRDVKALDESGVPVIGEAGSGYSIMEGYRLPPVMFTQEEAAAMLLGGKLAERMTDGSVKKHFDAALFKIKAVLRATDKEHVDNLDDHIAIFKSRKPEDSSGQYLSALQKAIVDKNVIFIRYCSGNEEVTERLLEPIGLCYYSAAWHLIAWCRLRNGYRDFLVERIQRLQVKDELFRHKTHITLQEYLKTAMQHAELQEAVVCFSKDVIKHLRNQKYYYGFVREEEEENFVRMFFVTVGFEGFARWLLMFTNAATIESPEALKTAMRSLASEVREHYQ
jgi:predicted DNA-binding transcriptional regulator YafY